MLEINRNPTYRILRQFSVAIGVFAALIGSLTMWHGGTTAAWIIWGLGAVMSAVGLVRPPWIRGTYIGMNLLTAPIGIVVSLAVLGVVYYIVVTPTGLLLRLFGYDPLQKRKPQTDTYWRKRVQREPDQYFRQF